MEQKDSNLNSAQETSKVKRLASAAELRGSKSGKEGDGKGGKGKMWISLIAMAVVLALSVGVYFAASGFKPEEETPEAMATIAPLTTYKLIARAREEVVSATIQLKGEEPYTLTNTAVRSGENVSYQYGIEGIPNFNMNTSMASAIIGYAANLVAMDKIEENVTDFSAYGMDDPTMVFTVNYIGGEQEVLRFGKQIVGGNSHYVCKEGDNAVYTIGSSFDTIHTSLNELAVAEMPFKISAPEMIINFLIEQKGKDTIEIAYDAKASSTFSVGNMIMLQPVKYDTNIDRVPEIMTALAALDISGYAGEKSELSEAGLDDPRAKIRVSDIYGNVLNFKVGNYKDASSVYVQIDDSETVYLAEASKLNFLNNVNVNYLINQFTNLVNILRVDELTVTAGENSYVMSIEREQDLDASGNQKKDNYGNPATIDSYYFNGAVVTESQFKDLYISMIGITMSKISDNYQFEGDVAVKLDYKLNVEPKEFVVEFLEYNDQYYAARRDGSTLALVKREQVDSIINQFAQFAAVAAE